MTRKVILTCAVTGGGQYNKAHPDFPITPQQIADAALEAEQAGASIYELGVTPGLHLAAGPPCETDFETFEFISAS